MNGTPGLRCVLLPCAGPHTWAVPQDCIAEIVTMTGSVSGHLGWRGCEVPVYGPDNYPIDTATDALAATTAIFVVFFGLRGRGCDYWAVRLQGHGLTSTELSESAIEDRPDLLLPGFLAAFTLAGKTCQVPDLPFLQSQVAAATDAG
ncbi:hypothetical protein [Kineobactrum sediminis]|nr:hypothetical protein [Kineobactrum sediminis]